MVVDDALLRQAREAGIHLAEALLRAEGAKVDYHQAIRRLHLAGASLREIADALDLSHQRVHQIIEAAGGTPDWRGRRRSGLDCSFCGAAKTDVGRLIAGPGVLICDGCVTRARAVIAHRPDGAPLEPAPAGTCSFCERAATDVTTLVAGPGPRICDECVQFCEEVIAATAPA